MKNFEEGKEQRAPKKKEKVNDPIILYRMNWKRVRSQHTGHCNCPTGDDRTYPINMSGGVGGWGGNTFRRKINEIF